jgi:hypothetical protein
LSAVAQRIGIAGGTANEKLAQRGANGAAALGAAFCWERVKALTPNNPTDEPDPAPFKVHLLTRAGRLMRVRSEPVRAFSTKDEAVRFAGRQLGGHYAVYQKHRKIWPAP